MRRSMRPGKDKRVFRSTSVTKKKINLEPTVYRGGICL